ncbi:Aspartate ammonia-lyase [hydrothermal vent metagenome]|uniref:Aspartate ammonia-lyase n=1 Tax=hydrothermal vent metagenome TaxID=652676 RepID=A0A1W1BZH7_9ZZZZ
MILSRSLLLLLLGGSASFASSLAVYQDQTIYTTMPKENYIGFAQGIKAKCGGNTVPLSILSSCPENKRLCKLLSTVKSSEQELRVVQSNIKVLNQLISLPKPTSFDADNFIETARQVGEEQAKLSQKEAMLNKEVMIKQRDFQKQAPTRQAVQTVKTCKKALELTIPRGYIFFSTNYEADIEAKEITVTQNLSIVNRSGIDIEADRAMFYYRSAHQYVNPLHFNPWIVSKYVPAPKRVYKSKKMMNGKEVMLDMAMVAEESVSGSRQSAAPVASYEDAREYKIKDLTLPSTGVPLDVQVLQWKAPLECEVRAYPYANSKAFQVCSFKPKFQIDSNKWKIKEGEKVINENATGEYYHGKYDLYTTVEEDIKILRKPIVQKERETGIFGGTARKKDGFVLTLTNKSDRSKTLTLVDRIPASTTDEIKVKLLSVNSDKKIDYKMLKNGKIEMKIILGANETKKIEVLFEISYDKELKINY